MISKCDDLNKRDGRVKEGVEDVISSSRHGTRHADETKEHKREEKPGCQSAAILLSHRDPPVLTWLQQDTNLHTRRTLHAKKHEGSDTKTPTGEDSVSSLPALTPGSFHCRAGRQEVKRVIMCYRGVQRSNRHVVLVHRNLRVPGCCLGCQLPQQNTISVWFLCLHAGVCVTCVCPGGVTCCDPVFYCRWKSF